MPATAELKPIERAPVAEALPDDTQASAASEEVASPPTTVEVQNIEIEERAEPQIAVALPSPAVETVHDDAETEELDLGQLIDHYRVAQEYAWPEPDFSDVDSDKEEVWQLAISETDEKSEEVASLQITETYEEILALYNQETSDENQFEAASYEAFVDDAVIQIRPETGEAVDPPIKFAEFIASRSVPESDDTVTEAVSLETVREMTAAEQPAEEVLASLVPLLSETADQEIPQDEALPLQLIEIKEALAEIHQEIEAVAVARQEDPSTPPLTPELTRQLISLMEAVGYEDPKGALIEFVNRHGLDFVLQAMEYLYQLSHEENRREFTPLTHTMASADDETPPIRMGQTVMRLIGAIPAAA